MLQARAGGKRCIASLVGAGLYLIIAEIILLAKAAKVEVPPADDNDKTLLLACFSVVAERTSHQPSTWASLGAPLGGDC